jgi:hypothetical protein
VESTTVKRGGHFEPFAWAGPSDFPDDAFLKEPITDV